MKFAESLGEMELVVVGGYPVEKWKSEWGCVRGRLAQAWPDTWGAFFQAGVQARGLDRFGSQAGGGR